ncbi:hypothetical protein [Nocardia macrotermitis]|uniref:Uncharacterized protein n=1 Tax=Nocardia macrotermitis TaxID=2585198 RepID=A0A7K0D7E1_9NOCA|nr:hypothetical protein [Nocardia macrotermitis]MQY21627.1 hypothetical protein [Nocardia macrotermitis]
MDFSVEQFESIIKKIEDQLGILSEKVNGVPAVVDSATAQWWVTDAMESAIRYCGKEIIKFGKWLYSTIKDLLKGIAAPVYMAIKAWDWYEIRGTVTQIAGDLNPDQSRAMREWQGAAEQSYKSTSTVQNNATKRIGDIADKAATSLAIVATAGLTFYAALLGILYNAIAAMVSMIVELGSGVLCLAGIATVIATGAETSISITGIVIAITALIAAETSQMFALMSATTDNSSFPNGKWPDSESSTFNDSSRLNGTAPWSVK